MDKTKFLKDAYTKPSVENIQNLIDYLKSISGRALSVKCRRQNAFKTIWLNKENDLIARCHIQNAQSYLEYLIQSKFSAKQIKIIIADIAGIVNQLDANEYTDFISVSTNTLPSAIHFNTAKSLFYNHQLKDENQNNYAVDLLTLYAIRLSLENRVRRFLGIDFAENNRNRIGLSQLIKVSKKLKSVEYSKKFDWNEIEWVNNWLNHHMHRNIRPYPWNIHQAIESLDDLIDPKEPIKKGQRTIYSFYSATYVNDENEFNKEVEFILRQMFPHVKIHWLLRREIAKNNPNT